MLDLMNSNQNVFSILNVFPTHKSVTYVVLPVVFHFHNTMTLSCNFYVHVHNRCYIRNAFAHCFPILLLGNIFKVSRIPNFFQKEKILACQSELLVFFRYTCIYNDLNSWNELVCVYRYNCQSLQ